MQWGAGSKHSNFPTFPKVSRNRRNDKIPWIRKVSRNRRNDQTPWKVIISRDFVVLLFLDTFWNVVSINRRNDQILWIRIVSINRRNNKIVWIRKVVPFRYRQLLLYINPPTPPQIAWCLVENWSSGPSTAETTSSSASRSVASATNASSSPDSWTACRIIIFPIVLQRNGQIIKSAITSCLHIWVTIYEAAVDLQREEQLLLILQKVQMICLNNSTHYAEHLLKF